MGARGTAFASDFDGTLCESDWETRTQTIKPADVEAVRRYQREGGLFGICTGRAFDSAAEPLEGIIEPDFYIVTTGAQIYLKDQGFILDAEIDREVARSIAEHFYDREGARLVVVSGTEFLTVGASRYSMREVASIDEVEGPITGVSLEFNGDIEAAARAQVEVERVFGDSVWAFQNLSSVDIVCAGCSKGTGTKRVKEVFGCSSIAGIGDSYNDLALLNAADVAYTFHKAPVEVQAAANAMVDSVAEALAHFCGW